MRHGILILLAAASVSLFGSCMREQLVRPPSADGSETSVRLTIRTPRTHTRAWPTDVEYTVDGITLLVFSLDNNEYVFQYMVDGEHISTDGNTQTTTFSAKLQTSVDPLKVLIVANHSLASATISESDTEDEVRTALVETWSGAMTSIPMYGEFRFNNGLDVSTQHNINVPMLRALARAEVILDLDPDTPTFEIDNVAIYRADNRFRIIPDADAMAASPTPTVSRVSIPDGAAPVTYSATDLVHYIPESASISDPGAQISDATCIVVWGRFNGSPTTTYYRIDFNGIGRYGAQQPFGQILRNYDYRFSIRRVFAEGWPNPEDAATNAAQSIIADLVPWNSSVSQIYFGDNMADYMMLEKNELTVRSAAGSAATVEIISTVPFTFGFSGGERVSSSMGSFTTNQNLTMSAEITSVDDRGAYQVYTVTITGTTLNNTDAPYSDILSFYAGQWQLELDTYQLPTVDDIPRVINVLSAGDGVGGLGGLNGNGLPGSMSQNLRNMLINPSYFGTSSAYVNNISGLNLLYSEEAIFENDANQNVLRLLLLTTDVLILTYDITPTVNAATMIEQWLEANNNRVLIVMHDNASSNANVIAELSDDPDEYGLTWNDFDGWFSQIIAGIFGDEDYEGFVVEDNTSSNAPFLNGVFGAVANNAETNHFTGTDKIAQYITTPPGNVIPLIVFGMSVTEGSILGGYTTTYYKNSDNVALAVDPVRRIIYCGEGELTQSQYGNINGTSITGSPMNTLWLNIWAWIANTVVGE